MAKVRGPRVEGVFDWLKKKRPVEPRVPPIPLGVPPGVDLYAMLGIYPDASTEEIRVAYRSLARKFHPDANPNDPIAMQRFQEISRAFEVLHDPERRAKYDRERAAAGVRPAPPPPPPGVIIPAPPMFPATPTLFEAFRGMPPPPPTAPEVMKAPPRPPGMWEIMFGAPQELRKETAPPPSIFAPYAPGETPFFTMPPVAPPRMPQAPARAATPPWQKPGFPPAAAPPRVPTPTRAPGLPAPPPAEIFPTVEMMAEFMRSMWPLDAIWDLVRDQSGTEEFRQTGTIAVDRLAGLDPRQGLEYELAEWLGISEELVNDYNRRGLLTSAFWKDVLHPMFDIAGLAFETLKPQDIPGVFYIGPGTDQVGVDLFYTEQAGRRPGR